MAPNDIAKHLRRHPFQPLRIHLSSGEKYDVYEPWHAGTALTEMWIGIDPDDDGIPRRSVYADTRHVTLIEPLPNGQPNGGNGRAE